MPTESMATLLLVGALYSAAMAALTMVAARWLQRGWMVVEDVPV